MESIRLTLGFPPRGFGDNILTMCLCLCVCLSLLSSPLLLGCGGWFWWAGVVWLLLFAGTVFYLFSSRPFCIFMYVFLLFFVEIRARSVFLIISRTLLIFLAFFFCYVYMLVPLHFTHLLLFFLFSMCICMSLYCTALLSM